LSLTSVEELNAWVREVKNLVKEFQRKKAKEMAQAKKKAEEDGVASAVPGSLSSPPMLSHSNSSPSIVRR